jgi:hypothetical protein
MLRKIDTAVNQLLNDNPTPHEASTQRDEELRNKILSANTIPALDKLRGDVVAARSKEILKFWQYKFWERKKKYSYAEVQELIQKYRQLSALNGSPHHPTKQPKGEIT